MQYAQAQTSANVNNSTRLPTPSFPSRTSNIRSRFSKPKVTPYGLVSVSETKEANKPQTIYQTSAQPQSYSVYAPLLPTPGTHEGLAGSGKVTDSNNVETSGQMDMEWEDDTGMSSGALPAYASYSQNNPQKRKFQILCGFSVECGNGSLCRVWWLLFSDFGSSKDSQSSVFGFGVVVQTDELLW